ncbi:MAG: flagellar filament capping protein FliD [Planctomycetota bacterium]
MGQITTGIGLISGLNTADIIDQLIAIESRPRLQVEQRNEILRSQQVAYQDVNANLLGLRSAANALTSPTAFTGTAATSSDESIATITSGAGATPGTYALQVAQLVSAQQTVTAGFADATTAAISDGGAVLAFDRGDARLDSTTTLDRLNGGQGVTRGLIRITDRAGAASIIDLSATVTVDDVVDQINRASGANVVASVDGDRLVLQDASGATTQALSVTDIGGTGVAASLGLSTDSTADADGDDTQLSGAAINTVGRGTFLAQLNDGNGVRAESGSDLQITDTAGATYLVDLTGANSLGDVFDAIETATAGVVTASVNTAGTGLLLTDTAGGGGTVAVTSANGSQALSDLGLDRGSAAGGFLEGDRVVASINSKLLRFVNAGRGLDGVVGDGVAALTTATNLADLFGGAGLAGDGTAANDLEFLARNDASTAFGVDLDGLTTVGDLINAVDSATSGAVTLAIDGNRLTATDTTAGSGNLTIRDLGGASPATRLGIAIDANVSSISGNPVLAQPAAPAAGATVRITSAAGVSADLDLSAARSVQDVLDTVNNAGLGVTAELNDAGNGIRLTDNSATAGSLVVADLTGTAAAQLGLAGTFTEREADSGSLSLQYLSEGTTLQQLGVQRGRFRITDSNGASATVDLTQGNEITLKDVISEINSRGLAVNARINDQGNGLLIEDTGLGATALSIIEDGSTTAADLGIVGIAGSPGADLDGAFRKRVVIEDGASLQDAVNAINDAGVGVAASIINDGSLGAPFRLSLAAEDAGSDGAFVFDDNGLGLGAFDLNEAQDAVVFFGSDDPAKALVVTSTSNTLEGLIEGATIDLRNTSEGTVRLSISEDREAVVESVRGLVTAFNSAVDTINQYDSFDSETETRGLLLGESAVLRARQSIYNAVINPRSELTGAFNSLASVGVRVGTGARLQFDEERFRNALQTDPDAVRDLFALETFETDPVTGEEDRDSVVARGAAVFLGDVLEGLTEGDTSAVGGAINNIQQQIDANNDRIETLNERLGDRRARLEAEFVAMERALAELQDQSASLGQISNLS